MNSSVTASTLSLQISLSPSLTQTVAFSLFFLTEFGGSRKYLYPLLVDEPCGKLSPETSQLLWFLAWWWWWWWRSWWWWWWENNIFSHFWFDYRQVMELLELGFYTTELFSEDKIESDTFTFWLLSQKKNLESVKK